MSCVRRCALACECSESQEAARVVKPPIVDPASAASAEMYAVSMISLLRRAAEQGSSPSADGSFSASPDGLLAPEDPSDPETLFRLVRGPHQQDGHDAVERQVSDELHPIEDRKRHVDEQPSRGDDQARE